MACKADHRRAYFGIAVLAAGSLGLMGCGGGTTWQETLIEDSKSEYAAALSLNTPFEDEDDVAEYIQGECDDMVSLTESLAGLDTTASAEFEAYLAGEVAAVVAEVPEDVAINNLNALEEGVNEQCATEYQEASQLVTGSDSLYETMRGMIEAQP